MTEKCGPLVRLWGIHSSQLPPASATPQELAPFLQSILAEALPFIGTMASPSSSGTASPWKATGKRTFAHSASPVELFERNVPATTLAATAREHRPPHVDATKVRREETWAARRSVHEDAATRGTASWDEWVRCFKEQHAQAEQAFTPTVLGTRLRRRWDCDGVEACVDGETWTDWTLRLEESVHAMPSPLRARVFPVLQATAAARGRRAFLVVQMAVDADAVETDAPDDDGYARVCAGAVRGAYTSVERLAETTGGAVEWIMATASDARGVLPAWVQRMAVPGQIAKDVDLFLGWIAEERDKTAP